MCSKLLEGATENSTCAPSFYFAPEDCALAYADLLDDVGTGRLTPEEAQTISAIVAKRAELFTSVELATEIEALKAQLAAVVGAQRAPTPIRRPFAIA